MTTSAKEGGPVSTGAKPDAPLTLEVFTSPTRTIRGGDNTFPPTTSTLVLGRSDAVLVDAQFITEDVDGLAEMIDASGRTLRTIFITHGHADHYFGIARLQARFPQAQAVTTRGVTAYIDATIADEIKRSVAWFGNEFTHPTVRPAALEEDSIVLDGHRLPVIEVGQGDIKPSAILHVPPIDAVIAGDIVYNQVHAMLALGGPEDWANWAESIDAIERLNPTTVVAGHKKPEGRDDDVRAILDGTRNYIRDFAAAVSAANSSADVITAMTSKYPDHGNLTTLVFSASVAMHAKH